MSIISIMSIIKKYLFMVLVFCLFPLVGLSSSSDLLNSSAKVHKVSTENGIRYGFFVTSAGHFLTTYDIVSNLRSASVGISDNFSEYAFRLNSSYLESYSLLKVNRVLSDSEVLPLGDSDSVDRGDLVYMLDDGGNLSSGKVLFKLSSFNEYLYPCFITSFENSDVNLGKPIFSIDNRVIGIFSSYKGNYFVLPINSVKPLISDFLRKPGDLNDDPNLIDLRAITQFGSNLSYAAGFISDISFDNDHNLYFLDSEYNSLGKIHMGGLYGEFSSETTSPPPPPPPPSGQSTDDIMMEDTEGKDAKAFSEGAEGDEDTDLAIADEPSVETVNRISFKEPISFTVSDAGIIYVLDRASRSIILLNKDFMLVGSLSYEKISSLFEPIKLRSFGNVLLVETDTGRYYRLSFDKGLGKTKAILLGAKLNARNNKQLVDISYGSNYSYWLFSSSSGSSSLYVVDSDFNVKDMISLPMSFPSSLSVYEDKLYILDKELGRVSIYDKSGIFLRYWNASLSVSGAYPSGISISSYGVVAVSYRGFSSFGLFSIDGEFIKSLGPLSKDGGVLFPVSVSYNDELRKLGLVGESSSFYVFSFDEAPLGESINGDSSSNGGGGGKGIHPSTSVPDASFNSSVKKLNLNISMERNGSSEGVEGDVNLDELNGEANGGINGGAEVFFTRKLLLKEGLGNLSLRGLCSTGDKFVVSDVSNSFLISFPYDSSNNLKKSFYGNGMGNLAVPIQLAYLNNELFILDKGNNRVVVMDRAGSLRRSFLLRDSSSLLYGQDIALSNSGNVFVLASGSVFVYSSSGELLNDFSIKRGDNSYLGYAKGIAWAGGFIYVADTYNNRILVYSEEGILEGYFGSKGGDLGNLYHPWDISIYGSSLYVADRGNHRAVLYSLGGE